jgi:hypothetical protein
METIKRQILLENSIDRDNYSKNWGGLTASTFYIKILLTQTMDDIGLYTDLEFDKYDKAATPVDYTILKNKLNNLNISFPFMKGKPNPIFTKLNTPISLSYPLRYPTSVESDYYNYLSISLSAVTESKIEDLKTYDSKVKFKTNFDINKTIYDNYLGNPINGVDRIISLNNPNIYVFDAVDDATIGTNNQIHGLRYLEYTDKFRYVDLDGRRLQIPLTVVNYIGEGFNSTNTSLSGITKEEYLLGITSVPEVYDDVFIERGINSVFENHLRLSEIKTLGDISSYNNGYFKVIRQ